MRLHRLLVAVGPSSPVPAAVSPTRGGHCGRGFRALLTGLRTASPIAWFPLVILLFQVTESTIVFRDAVRIGVARRRHRVNR